jgi:hypothetical protein
MKYLEVQALRKGGYHVQANRIHADRTIGSDCHYRAADGGLDAGLAASEETSEVHFLQVES